MTAISLDPTRLRLLPTFISHTHTNTTTDTPPLYPSSSHTLTLASPDLHQHGHRSRPLDLQAVLPGNLTPCHCSSLLERLSCRAQSQPRDAFPSLGSLFRAACLVVQLPKLSQAGTDRSARTVSCSTHRQRQQRRLCRAATALAGLVPQSVRHSARLRLHHAPKQTLGPIITSQREKGCRVPTKPS